ncbi:sensor histidine kinase [Desertibaculum subflavum]|uniref:sensor histidine kinase n=1 Tax=Desertibaculum subflavum TaxID=2268458 RepID=UPI000E6629F4
MSETIGFVADYLPPVAPSETCGAVYQRFSADPDLITLAVVDAGRPVGLVNRHDLLLTLARDYGRALYALKPVTVLMDAAPLIVDVGTDVDLLQAHIVAESPSALVRGFLVVKEGRYAGVCTALSLLRLTVLRSEQRSRDLEAARHEAMLASRSKSQFLANMSHELRTPLNAIIGFSEVLQTELYGPLGTARYAEYAGDIHASGQHLLAIINDILDMAKIEAGRMELRETAATAEALIHSTVRIITEQVRIARLQLSVDIVTPVRLRLDERAARQMLLNLLSNAIKFTPPTGRIVVQASLRASGEFAIDVRDTGIGIAPEELDRVLRPFGQVDNELTRRHAGTGLGLSLVKALIELHGGRLAVEPAPGGGTLATLLFPAARVLAEEATRAIA